MKLFHSAFIYLLAFLGFTALAVPAVGLAQESNIIVASSTDPAAYPLDVCVVSGEKLGTMGQPFDHIHRQDGQPDRLVRLCCQGCLKDFNRDPARYLRQIDDAAVSKAKPE